MTVTVLTRLRLDAALYEPAPPYSGKGRPRKKGKRLPTPPQVIDDPNTHWTRLTLPWYGQTERELEMTDFTAVWFHYGLPAVPMRGVLIRDVAGNFEPQALLSTDPTFTPAQILTFFLRRWQMEPTFQHLRTHLGVETQRQGSDKAIARTPPTLLGLFSCMTLRAHTLIQQPQAPLRSAAWYPKVLLTFSDALARQHLWTFWTFHPSVDEPDRVKVPRALLERFNHLLCYAA